MVNTHWGDIEENNHFGTHEFMALCEMLGAEAYVNGNVGSGTVREMSEWVEYLTRADDSPMARLRRANGRDEPWKVPFFGIGNGMLSAALATPSPSAISWAVVAFCLAMSYWRCENAALRRVGYTFILNVS